MPRETPVREVMTSDVLTLRSEMPLEEAVGLLAERGVSGAPVVDERGHLVGLLDDTDILTSTSRLHAPTTIELLGAYIRLPGETRRYTEELRHQLARTVGELMETKYPALGVDATVEDAATALVESRLSRVLVVGEDGELRGIVTRGDLVGALRAPTDEP